MKLFVRLLFFACLLIAYSQSAAQKVPLGAPAPSVGASVSVQGKPLTQFEPGTVYVLEFWATWCGPCHAAVPHLNDLADKFAGKPVEIYSVSNEPAAKVEPFLKRAPMRTNVIAGAESLFESYGVRVLPCTVVVDKAGRVAAFTQPEAVTEAVLNALLANRKIDVPVARNTPASFDWDKDIVASSVGHVLFRYSDSAGGGSRFVPNSGQITADGVVLRNLITLAFDTSYMDLQWKGPADEVRYRVSVKAPDKKDATARAMLADALARSFNLQAEWQDVEREVYVLRAKGPVTLKPSAGPSNQGGARHGSIVWPDATSKVLAELLGSYGVNRTVVDETGLTGRYALAMEWTPGDVASLGATLATLGLELTKETRKVPTLVVASRT